MINNFSKVKNFIQPCVFIAIILFSLYQSEASTWHTITKDTSKEEIKQIVQNAVNEKLKGNNNKPIHFSDIPALEEGWEAEKRQHNQEWLNKYTELHRKWLDRFNKLSMARSANEGKGLIESNISAIDKNIQALKRQREREEQLFDQDLNEIRESAIVWGKANFGTGETKDLTLAQIKDKIKIFSGKSAVKDIKEKTINRLKALENDSIVIDRIVNTVNGHYKITSVFPEELSRIDHENEDWRYLVQKIEVCPFTKDSNNKLEKAALTTFVKGGFLRNVSEVEAFLANEQLKNPNLKKWLEEELKNLDLENSEIAKKILSTEAMFKKREEEINKDISRLTEQKMNLIEQLKKITAEESLKYLSQEFRDVSMEYKGHYSQRIILGSRKIFDTPKSSQNLSDVFAAMVSEALNSHKLDEGDYTQYILRENERITDYIEKVANWTLKEKAFRISYLSRRNIGSQSQYIAYLQFKTRLSEEFEYEKCDEEEGTVVTKLRWKEGNFSLEELDNIIVKHNFYDSERNIKGGFKNNFIENNDGTITDLSTGLMWQKGGGEISFYEYLLALEEFNTRGFAGYNDWRMPTLEELASLLENKRSATGLFIYPGFTPLKLCWSTDCCVVDKIRGVIWGADYGNGTLRTVGSNERAYFRAVRSLQKLRSRPKTLSYEDVKNMVCTFGYFDCKFNETGNFENKFKADNYFVYDFATNLIWQRKGTEEPLTFDEARAYIDKLNNECYGGRSDWRLPTLEEIASLNLNRKTETGYLNEKVFHVDANTLKYPFWSSDKMKDSDAWHIDYSRGRFLINYNNNECSVLVVRDIQGKNGIYTAALRATPEILSSEKVMDMIEKYNFYEESMNINGNFENDFHDNRDSAIVDKKTGLMWNYNYNRKKMGWKESQEYVNDLNNKQYMGYSNWRLPTLEELASLLKELASFLKPRPNIVKLVKLTKQTEDIKKPNVTVRRVHLDIFSTKTLDAVKATSNLLKLSDSWNDEHWLFWSSDRMKDFGYWCVDFEDGFATGNALCSSAYVRAVCSNFKE